MVIITLYDSLKDLWTLTIETGLELVSKLIRDGIGVPVTVKTSDVSQNKMLKNHNYLKVVIISWPLVCKLGHRVN